MEKNQEKIKKLQLPENNDEWTKSQNVVFPCHDGSLTTLFLKKVNHNL